MIWLTNQLKAGVKDVRGAFFADVITIHDIELQTGAGMYKVIELSRQSYMRSGSAALSEMSRHEERSPGGYHNEGAIRVALKASDTGTGGPTNRSLLLRTGSANSVFLTIQDINWAIRDVAEDVDTDELVCNLEKRG